ncbi:MAG: aspartate--tRNA ligase [Clostridia bacterium]|nr:aspartate--tRNA ligase [Clostridia bacterium]
MVSLKNNKYHTHMCGNLNAKHIGAVVKVAGWVNNIRKMGALTFITLRDQTGVVQVFVEDEKLVENLSRESTVSITGEVRSRGEKNINLEMKTGEIEILAQELTVLGACTEVLPFEILKAREQNENTRMKYRYLDLRNEQNYTNIILRAELLKFIRQQMNDLEFMEVQTPILTSSSPEGARDFLVPSRMNPGNFYALPQSPQQFKQLLMVSGFNRYFQIAPCFRDEDARADRSPTDFYQLDFEVSFATQDEILQVLETVLYNTLTNFTKLTVDQPPFRRIKFNEAMLTYGSDKPDLRNPLTLVDLTEEFTNHEFSVFNSKNIFAIKAKANEMGRRFFDALTDYIKLQGAGGLVYLKYEENALTGPAAKFFSESDIQKLKSKLSLENGDTVFVIADAKRLKAMKLAGLLRNELGEKLDLIDKTTFKPCFVVDFPFYEEDDEGKVEFSHNPFSMPQGEMKALKEQNPFDIIAYQYDLVLNGVELASGAVRNHNPEVMVEAFRIAGYPREVVENKFPALFNAFKYGAPPHAGAAIGFDRLLMFICNEESIKEVIAFPMNKSAQDPLMGAPNQVTEQQLKDVHIKLDLPKPKKDEE